MVFEKLFKRENPNELTKQEQKAWQDLANKLIFTEKTNIPLKLENLGKIVEKIHDEYLRIEYEFEKRSEALHEQIPNMLAKATMSLPNIDEETKLKAIKEMERWRKEKEEKVELTFEEYLNEWRTGAGKIKFEKVKELVEDILLINVNGGIVDYGPWGFTPMLSIMKQEEKEKEKDDVFNYFINRNCFGITTTIASYLEKMEIDFDFGISANHPYLILRNDDVTYLVSNIGMKEFTGEKKMDSEFKTMRVVEKFRDLDGTFHGPRAMILVCDYNRGLIFELLENFEVLRQFCLGNDVTSLPGFYKKGLELKEKYGDILTKTDWKKLQWKLFPDIYKYFEDNKEFWEIENKKTEEEYMKFSMYDKLVKIFEKTHSKTEHGHLSFKEAQKELEKEIKPHIPEIIKYVSTGEELPKDINANAKEFFIEIKKEIDNILEEGNKENPKEYNAILEVLTVVLHDLQKKTDIPKEE